MMRPLAAFARPVFWALSVTKASSGRLSLSMRLYSLAGAADVLTGFLAKRIAKVSAVLILHEVVFSEGRGH